MSLFSFLSFLFALNRNCFPYRRRSWHSNQLQWQPKLQHQHTRTFVLLVTNTHTSMYVNCRQKKQICWRHAVKLKILLATLDVVGTLDELLSNFWQSASDLRQVRPHCTSEQRHTGSRRWRVRKLVVFSPFIIVSISHYDTEWILLKYNLNLLDWSRM